MDTSHSSMTDVKETESSESRSPNHSNDAYTSTPSTDSKSLGCSKDSFMRLEQLDHRLVDIMSISPKNHLDLTKIMSKQETSADSRHVFMPFYPKKGSKDRWKEIRSALERLKETRECCGPLLRDLILRYNTSYVTKWEFDGLLYFFNELEDDPKEFFEVSKTLSRMAELAFRIQRTVPVQIPFLKRGENRSIALSKEQIACLLAHAFFCTYPMRNVEMSKDRYSLLSDSLPLPSINFSSLFKLSSPAITLSKLKCIFNYFRRVTRGEYEPRNKVIFKRQSLKSSYTSWSESKKRFTQLHVTSSGHIEKEDGLLQVDFANKFVGGGVIGRGCVQEEICFLISPELIVSRLFTEVLTDDEVLIITGSEIYNSHMGYSSTFEWKADYVDTVHCEHELKYTQLVAMDAKKFQYDESQFDMKIVDRELNKAYCGFYCDSKDQIGRLPAVATGNWGCGAFGGDKHLKSLLQLMAAAEAGRDMCYMTHGDVELVKMLFDVYSLIQKHNLTVGDVYHMIINYVERVRSDKSFRFSCKLFEYITSTFTLGSANSSKETPV